MSFFLNRFYHLTGYTISIVYGEYTLGVFGGDLVLPYKSLYSIDSYYP